MRCVCNLVAELLSKQDYWIGYLVLATLYVFAAIVPFRENPKNDLYDG